jgi:phage baseplate assembly protein gpV
MKKSVLKLAAGIAVFTATSAITQAQTTATPPAAPEPTAYDKWEKEMKNPTDWFTWGADLRLRNEYMNNNIFLNESAPLHEQDYFRFRERIWASVMPLTNVSVNARFAGEQREWMKPSAAGQYGGREGFEERYGILDNAYVKWSNIGGVPLSLSAGRQDVQFGEPMNWWLVADGTPNDGSWTFFLDSIRAAFDAKDIQTKVDVVYIYQNARPDAWIPTLGRSSTYSPAYNLTEQNEQGVILYLSNKSVKDLQIDGYFIYKRDNQAYSTGDNADIYTIGSKISGTPATNWAYSVEGAYQFGHKQDANVGADYVNSTTDWRTINAYGANGKLTYLFRDKYNDQVSLIGEFLSGDDPNTKGTDEMFDILWGRYPRWSELYVYSYVMETSKRNGQMNNIIRFGPNWTCTPIKDTTFSATYNAMFSPVDTPTRAFSPSLFTNNGNFRGHYLQTILKHKFNDHVSAHLWGEFVWMGNYYQQRDLMTFLRAEVLFTF